jgi:hypothetical protein
MREEHQAQHVAGEVLLPKAHLAGNSIVLLLLIFGEFCNDPELATLGALFCCFIVSEMMVVHVMSGF